MLYKEHAPVYNSANRMTEALSSTLQTEPGNLPRDWHMRPLGDLIDIRNGYAFKSGDFTHRGILLIRQSNLSSSGISTEKAVRLPPHFIDRYAGYRIEKGNVLIGMSGSIGKLCVYDLDEAALQNQRTGLVIFRMPQIKEYVTHYLRYIEDDLLSLARGEAVKNISARQIKSFPIPVPPREQAQYIAHRLNLLTAELMRAVAKLKSAKKSLIDYRIALLRDLLNASDAGAVPLGQVARITGGRRMPADHFADDSTDIPCFKVVDLAQIDERKKPYLDKAQGYISSDLCRKLGLRTLTQGTIVFAKNGGAIALNRRAILSKPSLIDNNMMGIIGSPDVLDNTYLYYFTLGLQLFNLSHSTTMPSVRKIDVAAIEIPLPPISKQKQLVTEIDRRFTQIKVMQSSIDNAARQADLLTRSILKRAFEGKLKGNRSG